MDYKVLYRKYRPDNFANIIGQDYMISILKNTVKNNKISHAYIFSGPRGTGKTSTAKVFAKAINCLNPNDDGPCNECESCLHFKENADIIEIDAASNNGVDEIREIINNIKLAPAYSKYKVYIIDEVHMLSTSAFNALLLTLEEPPKHVVFILATTNIEAVPITILSRCQRFDFHKISLNDIKKRLTYVISEENIKIDDDALEEIAYISDGGMRDALSILDQLSSNSETITLNEVVSHFGSVSKKQISDLYKCIIDNNIDKFNQMLTTFKELAIDYKILIKKLLEKIEEEAINSKKLNDYKGLPYIKLKEMAFEIASISNYINININPYQLIEIVLLNYFPGNNPNEKEPEIKEADQPKIISNSEDTITLKTNEPELVVAPEPPKKVIESNYDELIKIRVNNCFVNAKKDYLQYLKSNWTTFVTTLKDKELLNILMDSDIVAASDKVGIITNNLEGTVNLINSKLNAIEKQYESALNENYLFIALTNTSWQKEKATYIDNLKNKIIYKYIKEKKEPEPEIESPADTIEEMAFNIFDKEKIEFE